MFEARGPGSRRLFVRAGKESQRAARHTCTRSREGSQGMRCPICGKKTSPEGNPYRPFCSERCKLIDLDNWLSGRYRISTPVTSGEETQPAASEETPESGQDAKANRD